MTGSGETSLRRLLMRRRIQDCAGRRIDVRAGWSWHDTLRRDFLSRFRDLGFRKERNLTQLMNKRKSTFSP